MNFDEDIKFYFKNEQWDELSKLERSRYRDAYNLYQECLLQGIVLPEPDFMISNKENDKLAVKVATKPGNVQLNEEVAETFIISMKNLKSKEKEVENVYICNPCHLSFKSEEYLKEHLATCQYRILEETPSKGYVQCPFCDIYSTDRKYVENHLTYCHVRLARDSERLDNNSGENDASNSKKKFKCFQCNYRTHQRCHLKVHIRIHDGTRPYQCTICSKRFIQQNHLKNHYTAMHAASSTEKKFKCIKCPYQTNNKGHLNIHVRLHDDIKQFECSVCKKRFALKDYLKRHFLSMHTK